MKQALSDQNVAGGITAALGRNFTDGIGQVFSANPQAAIYYEGGFVGGIATGQTNTALKVGDTIDWFDFPAINNNKSVTIGGDVIAAFTTKPGVKEFIQYMTTSDAGSVWAGTGAIISPVKSVPASAYPNDLAKREAAQVANASAVRFDGSDLLPSGGGDDMGAALQDALQQGDAGALARVAHELNGSSGNLGVRKMRQLCVELQALGKAKDLTQAGDLLAQLVSEFEVVRQRLMAEHATIAHDALADEA